MWYELLIAGIISIAIGLINGYYTWRSTRTKDAEISVFLPVVVNVSPIQKAGYDIRIDFEIRNKGDNPTLFFYQGLLTIKGEEFNAPLNELKKMQFNEKGIQHAFLQFYEVNSKLRKWKKGTLKISGFYYNQNDDEIEYEKVLDVKNTFL